MQRLDFKHRVCLGLTKSRHRARQYFETESRCARHADASGARGLEIDSNVPQPVDIVVNLAHVAEELVRFGCRDELALDAVEQAVTELLLGVRQDLGDRWLGDVQRRGRVRNRAVRVDGVEYFDLSQAHYFPLSKAV